MTNPDVGLLELLVIQPTPFCNINCPDRYLPDRQNTRSRMAAQIPPPVGELPDGLLLLGAQGRNTDYQVAHLEEPNDSA